MDSGRRCLLAGVAAHADEYASSTEWAAGGGDVVIQLGTNDSWPSNWSKGATFLADCKALVTHYLDAPGKPRVWVSLVPPCCGTGGAVIANEIVPLLRTCAEETGVTTIDVFAALTGHPDYFVDGVHPNDDGAALIAQTVHDALLELPTAALDSVPPGSHGPVVSTAAGEPILWEGLRLAMFGAVACAFPALVLRRRRRVRP